ncbi:hypothetical protein BH20GEM2_BH20GEM2_16310 [soil metagenome]
MKQRQQQTFSATIEQGDRGGAFVTVPFDVEQVFGAKRPKVRATFDGVPYRGSLARMGGRHHVLGVLKEIRERIGKGVGDTVRVTVEADTEPRVVQVSDDLAAALRTKVDAATFFEELSYSHRREYVSWIEEAKRESTRRRRIEETLEMLQTGKKSR